jgi:hypothetical protein
MLFKNTKNWNSKIMNYVNCNVWDKNEVSLSLSGNIYLINDNTGDGGGEYDNNYIFVLRWNC